MKLYADDPPTLLVATATANPAGSFSTEAGAAPDVLRRPRARRRRADLRPRGALLYNIKATAVVAPASGPAGTAATATLRGFQPFKVVTLRWNNATTGPVLGSVLTDAVGSATLPFTVPAGTPKRYSVIAVQSATIKGTGTFTMT